MQSHSDSNQAYDETQLLIFFKGPTLKNMSTGFDKDQKKFNEGRRNFSMHVLKQLISISKKNKTQPKPHTLYNK